MTIFRGANNPGHGAFVFENGQIASRATSTTTQDEAAERGEAFNVNTGNITLTDAAETPVFYFKNTNEPVAFKIARIFLTVLESTDGTGNPVNATIYRNIDDGVGISDPDARDPLTLHNFNFGSGNTVDVTSLLGGTGITWSGGTTPIKMLFPTDKRRDMIPFETIIIPRGASMMMTVTPPSGNTSVVIQAGFNAYQDSVRTNV